MILGTPGFIGSRLVEARLERGIPVRALAERVEISVPAIYGYEKGASSPRADVLRRLCDALDVPERYFLMPVEEQTGSAVFYRAQRSTSVAACNAAEAKLSWLHRLGTVVGQFVDLPSMSLPDFAIPRDPLALSDGEVERFAVETRRYWGLGQGPISNMVALLEKHGVLLARAQVDADALDGLSQFFPDHAVGLLAANKESGPRSRFDVAHELGHLVLHRGVEQSRLNKPSEWRAFENQAHRFAAALLFPPEAFRHEVKSFTLDGFFELKMRWKVSVRMMMMQAQRLGFLSDDAMTRLHINYARRGYKRSEPLDEQLPPEQPRLIRRAIELWVAERGFEEVCAHLPFANRDIVTLTGVPRGVLTGESAQVLRLVPASTAAENAPGPQDTPPGGGTVTPLRRL
ncbi:helix-turn-helix domain-containing protein [Stigmatella aurantiaca]|uniref:Phage-like DNA-binding protein n=1 Tax=Stigmatella aurantiaca (strain DW4/3-1) TaxID=378806 RepID=E3FJE4_STIAD|nr:XRE family transcriptional regulator [Stigmatella aurantiaca]ADO70439.1 Phage-like DNA-binding protein [Stigmatella aurantiaca DW4/3-1]